METQDQLISELVALFPELVRALLAGSPRHHAHLHHLRELGSMRQIGAGLADEAYCPAGWKPGAPLEEPAGEAGWRRMEAIPLAQIKLMIRLANQGPQTMSELAEGMEVTTPAITGLVDKLEKRGLVERLRDQEDRRVVRVCLCPEAQEMARRHIAERREKVRAVLATLPPEEQQMFVRTLKLLARTLHPRVGEELEVQ
jgi:DNA-binding MarR family transcriptional regulator